VSSFAVVVARSGNRTSFLARYSKTLTCKEKVKLDPSENKERPFMSTNYENDFKKK